MFKRFATLRADKHVPATRSTMDTARGMLAARRAVQEHLPPELIHDPSLDMLLALFIAEADGVAMGAAELATTTTVGPATAGRLIKAMKALGLIEEDVTIALTATGRAAVTAAVAAASVALAKPDYAPRPRLRMLHQRDQRGAAERVRIAGSSNEEPAPASQAAANRQRLTVS